MQGLATYLYRNVIGSSGDEPATTLEATFVRTGRGGVYPFHNHYSTANEVPSFAGGDAMPYSAVQMDMKWLFALAMSPYC